MIEQDHPVLRLKDLLVFQVLEKIQEKILSLLNLFNKYSLLILHRRPQKLSFRQSSVTEKRSMQLLQFTVKFQQRQLKI